ncbi:MAG: hypothetical protein LBN71_05360 [Tannerella sp.]|nr:hypothetical protein [Tannerella sp.]
MKKILFLLSSLIFVIGCTEDGDNYPIPRDANGNVIFTQVPSATTVGISSLDNQFSVTATLPNAKSGDEMTVECLQLQTGGLLPLAGTQKKVTVGADLKATVSYTRQEANLNKVGDYVTVTYAGKTDYAIKRVDLVIATTASKTKTFDAKGNISIDDGIEVIVARNAATAYFAVEVDTKEAIYSGTIVAKRKNGVNEPFVDVAGVSSPKPGLFLVPISGNDFAANKDTMYYSFVATNGGFSDEITTSVVVIEPYFFLKKTATLTPAQPLDIFGNKIALSPTLQFTGGASTNIEFVPSTLALYTANNSNDAIAAFEAGVKSATAEPGTGEGVYIFKIIDGADTYYGMIKVLTLVPNTSISIEYRIGNEYSHLAK